MKNVFLATSMVLLLVFGITGCQQTNLPTGTSASASARTYTNPATLKDGVQTIATQFSARAYTPITVQVGVPVKWTIAVAAKNLNSCNNEIIIPKYSVNHKLAAGETIVEFTPKETGTIPYSCWMGMIRSSITVVENLQGESPR